MDSSSTNSSMCILCVSWHIAGVGERRDVYRFGGET